MHDVELKPEKITHPFQLMAAWFVMLILLSGILLAAAAKIDRPSWASGFLVISTVGLAVLVMAAVFVMLTKFRPNLQGPKEYAEWLKDKNRFQVFETSPVKKRKPRRAGERTEDNIAHVLPSSHTIDLNNLPDVHSVIEALATLGFKSSIYEDPTGPKVDDPSESEAIWIGSRVPASIVVLAIKAVVPIWPHLKFMHLSADSGGPDETHDQLFFGGASSTAKAYGLNPWTQAELIALPDKLDQSRFHKMVRTKYP